MSDEKEDWRQKLKDEEEEILARHPILSELGLTLEVMHNNTDFVVEDVGTQVILPFFRYISSRSEEFDGLFLSRETSLVHIQGVDDEDLSKDSKVVRLSGASSSIRLLILWRRFKYGEVYSTFDVEGWVQCTFKEEGYEISYKAWGYELKKSYARFITPEEQDKLYEKFSEHIRYTISKKKRRYLWQEGKSRVRLFFDKIYRRLRGEYWEYYGD